MVRRTLKKAEEGVSPFTWGDILLGVVSDFECGIKKDFVGVGVSYWPIAVVMCSTAYRVRFLEVGALQNGDQMAQLTLCFDCAFGCW